jgi:hypothetical protein
MSHPALIHTLAMQRYATLLSEADRERRLREAPAGTRPAIRRVLFGRLVRLAGVPA